MFTVLMGGVSSHIIEEFNPQHVALREDFLI